MITDDMASNEHAHINLNYPLVNEVIIIPNMIINLKADIDDDSFKLKVTSLQMIVYLKEDMDDDQR